MNKLIGVLITAAILLGVAACSVPAEPAPATTVTATVTPEPVIRYVETVKEVTPQVCLDALTYMVAYLTVVADEGPIYSDGLEAAFDHDVPGLTATNTRLADLRSKMDKASEPLKTAGAACQAKGK